jgi:hypothetical protein
VKYGLARRPSRRMMKVGIAAAAAIAMGGAFFASQAGAASAHRVGIGVARGLSMSRVNVMMKVPQGTTCAYAVGYFHGGPGAPTRKTGTRVFNFRALHWNSSAWNSIGQYPMGASSVRIYAINTPKSCSAFANSLPDNAGKEFWVGPSGSWGNDWFDASNMQLPHLS